MSFNPNFSVSQTIGAPSIIILTDTSTGSDVGITQRRVYLQLSDNTYLVPTGTTTNYIVWNYADSSIEIDVLNQDEAVSITVQWLSVTNVVLYSKKNLALFSMYNKIFFSGLQGRQASTPNITQDENYYTNRSILWGHIVSAMNAVEIGIDIYGAQNSIDKATYMINNQSEFF